MGCHCFCGAVHGSARGVCTGNAATWRLFHGGVARQLGMPPARVPICVACARASDASPSTTRLNVFS